MTPEPIPDSTPPPLSDPQTTWSPVSTSTTPRKPSTPRLRLAAAVALAGAVLAGCSGSDTPPAPTAVVDRGTVSQGVSASGTLVSITQQNLGFADGGRITELSVKVGDVVAAGQPLARLDDGTARSQLASAQAKLDQQTASLRKLTGGNSVASAQSALDSARAVLDATRGQVDATADANESAVARAQVQLDFDREQRDAAEEQLAEDERACPDGTSTTTSTTSTSTSTSTTDTGSAASTTTPASGSDPACSALATDKQNVTTAKRQVIASQTALDQARSTQRTDAAAGRLSIVNAEKSIADAQSQLDSATSAGPADIAVQDAVVADAQNTLSDARQGLEDTVLRAPVAGTVSAINGAVGDFVSAASAATTLAPGTDARIPAAVGTATSVAGTASPAGGALITLNDLSTFQLVVPFEESDAAKILANQPVDVSVDAVPDLTVPGTVVAVAPTADQISGVVSYYATIVLNGGDPRLKDGQTAQAVVRTESRENVLRVPTAAVRQDSGGSVVTVPGADGSTTTTFTPGLSGDEFTEVQSGLTEGQRVLLPSAVVEASTGGPGRGPGGAN